MPKLNTSLVRLDLAVSKSLRNKLIFNQVCTECKTAFVKTRKKDNIVYSETTCKGNVGEVHHIWLDTIDNKAETRHG